MSSWRLLGALLLVSASMASCGEEAAEEFCLVGCDFEFACFNPELTAEEREERLNACQDRCDRDQDLSDECVEGVEQATQCVQGLLDASSCDRTPCEDILDTVEVECRLAVPE